MLSTVIPVASVAPTFRQQPCCTSQYPHISNHECKSCNSTSTITKDKDSLDLTQRIERKLAEYNASQNVFKRWSFEILSWCVSLICMAAVVGIYAYVKNKPIRDGGLLPYANALGKIASAALIVPTSEALGQLKWNWFHRSNAMWDFEIFDKASRGPWGAAMLLFRTRGRSLAALGALLIILLLAIDTFLQQVVTMPERWALDSKVGMLPMTVQYKPDFPKVYRQGADMNVSDKDMFLVVEKFAFENGTQPVQYGNGTRPDIPLSCPTGNCTWPIYDTLGVCSQCEDVSALLDHACLNGTVDWTMDIEGSHGVDTHFSSGSMCGYFLNVTSSNPVLMSGYLVKKDGSSGETLLMRTLPLTSIFDYVPSYGNGSINFKEFRNSLADVLIVSAVNGSASNVRQRIRPVAHECVLTWCVKTIISSYDSGQYTEEVLHTFHNTTEGSFPWIAYPFITDHANGTDNYYLQDISIDFGMTPEGRTITGFGTANYTASSIIQGFQDIFPAFCTTINETALPVMRWKTWNKGPAWHRVLDHNPWLDPNNVTRHVERLATAMTNAIRSAPSKVMLTGNAFTKETFIMIRWEWLAFPFVLLLFSLVFLVSTIIKTSGDGEIGVWKTSAMPTLIYSLPHDARPEMSRSSTSDIKTVAETRGVKIRLVPKQGWRISGQKHTSPTLIRRGNPHAPAGWI